MQYWGHWPPGLACQLDHCPWWRQDADTYAPISASGVWVTTISTDADRRQAYDPFTVNAPQELLVGT